MLHSALERDWRMSRNSLSSWRLPGNGNREWFAKSLIISSGYPHTSPHSLSLSFSHCVESYLIQGQESNISVQMFSVYTMDCFYLKIKNCFSLSADFSKETLQARRGWQEVFQVMKGKDLHPRLLYPAKLAFRMEGQIKCFSDKAKLKEFIITKPLLYEMLKGFI